MSQQFRYITYSQQLGVLSSNVYISYDNIDKAIALNTIEKIGFNAIVKYLNCFKTKMSFHDIYKLYLFDSILKSESLRLIGLLERYLKSIISNSFISNHQFDSYCYLDINNFEKRQAYEDMFNYIIKPKNEKFIKPFWTIIERFSLGDLIKLFECMKIDDQTRITNVFNKVPKVFCKQLKLIKKIRNICAHFNDFLSSIDLYNDIHSSKVIRFFIIIKNWIPDQDEWNYFIKQVKQACKNIDNKKIVDIIQKTWKKIGKYN